MRMIIFADCHPHLLCPYSFYSLRLLFCFSVKVVYWASSSSNILHIFLKEGLSRRELIIRRLSLMKNFCLPMKFYFSINLNKKTT